MLMLNNCWIEQKDVEALLTSARILYNEGFVDAALCTATVASKAHPHWRAYDQCAVCHMARGRYLEATRFYAKALKIGGDDIPVDYQIEMLTNYHAALQPLDRPRHVKTIFNKLQKAHLKIRGRVK